MIDYNFLLRNLAVCETSKILSQLFAEEGISMPNIKAPVLDLGICWDTLAECSGWKLEHNKITGHARVLDDKHMRVAWGSLDAMQNVLKKLNCPWGICKKGDILAVSRAGGLYSHFAVYCGFGRIIHYAAENRDFGGKICIHEADFSAFLQDDTSYGILNFPDSYGRPEQRMVELTGCLGTAQIPNLRDLWDEIWKSPEYHLYSGEETVQRARKKIGETSYNLVLNNCEHFAIWCKTGISQSRQVEDFLRYGLAKAVFTVAAPVLA